MIALVGNILGEWLFVLNNRLHKRAAVRHLTWEERAKVEFKRTSPTSFRTGQAMRVKED